MFFKLKSYLLFLKKSTNQHGVHSPFVYNLVTKCFYKKTSSQKNTSSFFPFDKKLHTKKQVKLLYKILAYFKPKNILKIDTQQKTIQNILNQKLHTTKPYTQDTLKEIENSNVDFVFLYTHYQYKTTLEYFNHIITHAQDHSFFIIDHIHTTKEMNKVWHTIKNHQKVSVTIDIYRWGFIFFRSAQAKEHFNIRV